MIASTFSTLLRRVGFGIIDALDLSDAQGGSCASVEVENRMMNKIGLSLVAAALAVKAGCLPRHVDVPSLREALRKAGAIL